MLISVPVKIEVRYIKPGDEISFSDLRKIKDQVVIPKEKIVLTPVPTFSQIQEMQMPEPEIDTFALLEGYENLRRRAEELGDLLQARIGDQLNMKLDPSNPDLWEAAHLLFGGNFNEMTYAMYRQALGYMESLGKAMAEAT